MVLLRGIGGLWEIAETIGCPRLGPPSGYKPHDEPLDKRVTDENVQTNRTTADTSTVRQRVFLEFSQGEYQSKTTIRVGT